MDRTDYKILNILQADSRTTLKDIGDHVGLTAPAVSERLLFSAGPVVQQKFPLL
jgi:Lrp/AsnC family leucine-responsive transcriptional regulator